MSHENFKFVNFVSVQVKHIVQNWPLFSLIPNRRPVELCVSPVLTQNEDIWNFHGSLTLNKGKLIRYFRKPWYAIVSNMTHFFIMFGKGEKIPLVFQNKLFLCRKIPFFPISKITVYILSQNTVLLIFQITDFLISRNTVLLALQNTVLLIL